MCTFTPYSFSSDSYGACRGAHSGTTIWAAPSPHPLFIVAAAPACFSVATLYLWGTTAGRLYPPVAAVMRTTLRDVEYNGYDIPAGTKVQWNLLGAFRAASVYPQPEK